MSLPGGTTYRFLVDEEDAGRRLDSYLAEATGESRSVVQRAVKAGGVQVNGSLQRPSYRVREGDRLEVVLPDPVPWAVEPVDIPLVVLHEDRHLLVVDKPAGLVVHPGPGHRRDTLVNALLARVTDLSGIGGVLRPGIVHRLDRDTSGVLVVAKSDRVHLDLSRQFAEHSVERAYVALVARVRGPGLLDAGTFETRYGRHPRDRKRFSGRVSAGRRAVTHYRVTTRYAAGAMRVECRLETGRTHQVRVHLAEAGCPVIGDSVYGGRAVGRSRLIARQALHARVLGFNHPMAGRRMHFESELPADLREAEARLSGGADWR